jgi:MFS family permease
LILLLALVGFVAMPFAILMPAFAKDVFHGNATTLGLLNGAAGLGAVIGALYLTSIKGTQSLSRLVVLGCTIYGAGLIAFGCSSILSLSLLAVVGVGFGSMVVLSGSNTVIQTIVDKDKRGRVMSFLVMAFMGTTPFGGILAGSMANSIGVGHTVTIAGLFTLALALMFSSRIMNIHLHVKPAEFKANIKEGIIEEDLEMAAIGK